MKIIVIVIVCAWSSAFAQPCPVRPSPPAAPRSPEEIKTGKDLFGHGVKLQEAGKLEEACKMFESSALLDPQIGTRLNVADCRERRGQLLDARASFLEAAEEAKRAGDRREALARKRVEALEAKLVRLSIKLVEPDAPGMTMTLGRCALTKDDAATLLVVMPGPIVLDVSAPDRRSFHTEVAGIAGQAVAIDVPALASSTEDLRKAKEAEALAAVERRKAEQARIAAEQETAKQYNRHPARIWTLVAGGVGVGAIVTGAVFAVKARRVQRRYNEAGCGDRDQVLDADTFQMCLDDRETGERQTLLGNVFLASGAAVVAAAAIVFVIDPGNIERPESARSAIRVSPSSVQWVVRW